jgi:hypothetical protein
MSYAMAGNSDLDDLIRSVTADLRAAIERAYELGHIAAEARVQEKLANLTDAFSELRAMQNELNRKVEGARTVLDHLELERAPVGSVKPKILQLIRRPQGATTADMEAVGIKHNSIRGTLYALHKSGQIQKRGNHWYAVANESIGASSLEEAPQG